MYDNPFQAVALLRSGITNWAQLNGKRIGVDPPSGNGGVYGPAVFAKFAAMHLVAIGRFRLQKSVASSVIPAKMTLSSG
jgi:TRAP-type uncharacterized transport system substrate-binding protein